jgi:hypothetical protein
MRGYMQYYMMDLVNTMSREGGMPTEIFHGQTEVTTAGSPAQLQAASQKLRGGIWFFAKTFSVYIGTTAVKPTETTAIKLVSGSPIFLEGGELNEYWVDSDKDNAKVSWLGW